MSRYMMVETRKISTVWINQLVKKLPSFNKNIKKQENLELQDKIPIPTPK
jgi:hypothetical protein